MLTLSFKESKPAQPASQPPPAVHQRGDHHQHHLRCLDQHHHHHLVIDVVAILIPHPRPHCQNVGVGSWLWLGCSSHSLCATKDCSKVSHLWLFLSRQDWSENIWCQHIWTPKDIDPRCERLTTTGVISQPNAPPFDPPPYTERWYQMANEGCDDEVHLIKIHITLSQRTICTVQTEQTRKIVLHK